MKIKKVLWHLIISGTMFACIWLCSLLPVRLIDLLATGTFIAVFLAFGVLIWLTFKNRHIALLLCAVCVSTICHAQQVDSCASAFATSIEDGRWCTYTTYVNQYETELCNYIRQVNPNQAQKGTAATEMQEHINMADRIVQAFNDLDSGHQSSVNTNCQFLEGEEKDDKLEKRLNKLRANNTGLCCAWAMQTINQIYSSRNATRQEQTVPMILADEKTQCWPCDVIYLLIILVNTMAFLTAPAMAAVGLFFIKCFFMFWLLVKVGQLFLNYDANQKTYGGVQFLKDFFIRVLCISIIAIILGDTAAKYDKSVATNAEYHNLSRNGTNLEQVYQKILNPMFEFVAGFGVKMTHTLLDGQNSFYGRVAEAVKNQSDASVRVYGSALQKVDYCAANASPRQSPIYSYLRKNNANLNLKETGVFIEKDLATGILCLTQLSYRGISPIAAIGSVFTTDAIVNSYLLPSFIPGRFPKVPQLFYGLLLNIICWLIGIIVAFKVIDIMLRVSLVVMLMPMFIAAWAFPLTRSYAMKGFIFFMSAVMGFVQLALAVGIIVPFFFKVLAGKNEDALVDAIVAPSSSHYVSDLYDAFMTEGGKVFIYILGIGWLAKYLLDGVQGFFQKVFGFVAVGNMAGGGSLSAVQKAIRGKIGAVYDSQLRIREGSTPFKHGFRRRMKGGLWEKGWQAAGKGGGIVQGHATAATRRVYDAAKRSPVGKIARTAKNKAQAVGSSLKNAGAKVKDFMHNNRVARTWRAVKASPVVNNKVTRGVWAATTFVPRFIGKTAVRTAKKLPAYAKKQFRKGVYQFFHPDQK